MHKLAIAAAAVATVTAGGIVVATTARSGDAHASSHETSATPAANPHGGKPTLACAHSAAAAPSLPSLLAPNKKRVMATATVPHTDCSVVGDHLADLEAGTGHTGDDHARCATDYASICASEDWSLDRRLCVLAADDLINAHLCASKQTTAQDGDIPATLACSVIAPHLAPIVQGAGLYADVADFAQQIESACDNGSWSLGLRQCFADAQSIDELHACIQ